MRTNKMMSMMIVVAVAFVFMGGCALREKGMEGVEGEGEGEGEACDPNADYTCTCSDGSTGFQVCREDGTLGPCNCGSEGEGEGCEGEGEGGSECTSGQIQCVDNSWQICGDNGFWGDLVPCAENQTCTYGVCVDNNPPDTETCAVWIENGMLCGDIGGLSAWTFGCMPPGVEPVCALQTANNGACAMIPTGVDSAWPRSGEDWLTVVGCNVYDGLKIMSDPSGGHYLKLP